MQVIAPSLSVDYRPYFGYSGLTVSLRLNKLSMPMSQAWIRDDYPYGYSPKGERLEALKSGTRKGRINMIAALCHQQLLAPFTIEGACNRLVFETWLETGLIPALKPDQKLVIDNATFHKGGRIQELVEAAGCEIWYLPAYSPDFNKIEPQWATLKSRIRKQLDQWPTLRDAIEYVLRLAS